MARTGLVIIGHSHLSSIVHALNPRPGEEFAPDRGCEYFVFNTVKYGSDFVFSTPSSDGGFQLNPVINDLVAERVPGDYDLVMVSMFGGNAHNALTLLQHPQPFDFVLPEQPDLPRIEGARHLPSAYIASFLKRMAAPYMLNLETLRHAHKGPLIHIESPPPIGDDDFIMKHLEDYFKGQYPDPRPAPRWLRYKLWRLHSNIIRHHAAQLGVEFVPAPAETMDADGYLARDCYGTDATHGGQAYGLAVLKQLEAKYGMPYGGWSWL